MARAAKRGNMTLKTLLTATMATGLLGFSAFGLHFAEASPLRLALSPVPGEIAQPAQSPDAPAFSIPASVRQGEVLKVIANGPDNLEGGSVSMMGRSVKLFRQNDGSYLGLVSVSVFQKPGGYSLQVKDAAGNVIHSRQVSVANGNYPVQNLAISKSTQGLQPLPGEMEAIEGLKNTLSLTRFWEEPFITPTPDCQNSPYGVKRAYNGKLSDNYHRGVDLRSPAGRPIKATNNGVVKIARMFRLHGGTVGIDHGQGIGSVYIHMSKIAAKEGQMVKKGDVIGYVGSTGFATGPHLHWGLYVSGQPVNPNQWIKNVPRCGG